MAIDALPSPPLRSDPLNFAQKAENFMNALPKFADQANALESSIIAATNTATSTTSLSVSAGTKSLTASTGKSFGVNSRVTLVSTSDQTKAMNGLVQDYNSSTGAMTFNCEYFTGSGTASDWFIYYSSPQTILTQQANVATLGANTFTGPQTLPGNAATALEAVPKQQLDSGLATKADLAGSSSQVFSVGAAASGAHAVRLDQFSKTSSTSARPDGLLEKWGYVSVGDISTSADGSVNFPSAFPSACYNVSLTPRTQGGQGRANFCLSIVNEPSNTGFSWTMREFNGDATAGAGFFWRAIGG